jgi:hypothetical protein
MRWRRAALWGMLAAKVAGGWGVTWDIQWHVLIGRDSFWIPPHLMTYAAVVAVVGLALGTLAHETLRTRGGRPLPGAVRLLGLAGTRGSHLAWWGIAITVLAAPVDDLWHRLFGLDVTLWSPPHLLGLLGSQVNSVGCLLLAVEAYPAGSRARWWALLLGGAMFFGTFHLLLGPAVLWAHAQGGLAFFYYAILGALLLPPTLLPLVELTASRWSAAQAVLLAAALALAGGAVAKAGFDLVQPESAIEEAIARDPTSPIARAHQMARENGRPVVTYTGRARAILWALPAALALGLLAARGRPVAAGLAFALLYLALAGWSLSRLPALGAALPTASETVVGALTVLAAGALAGLAGHRLGGTLAAPTARLRAA